MALYVVIGQTEVYSKPGPPSLAHNDTLLQTNKHGEMYGAVTLQPCIE